MERFHGGPSCRGSEAKQRAALAAGVIGALLAVLLQRAAIVIAGFLAGGYAVLALFDVIEPGAPLLAWLSAFVGDVIGVVLTLVLFEWGLISLSSITGAWLITQTLRLQPVVSGLAFGIMLGLGIAVQAVPLSRSEPDARQAAARVRQSALGEAVSSARPAPRAQLPRLSRTWQGNRRAGAARGGSLQRPSIAPAPASAGPPTQDQPPILGKAIRAFFPSPRISPEIW